MTMIKSTVACAGVLLCALSGPLFAEGKELSGSELFSYHGCINCHGAEASDPVSKMVPTLAGKPADQLFSKAKKILSGEAASKESEIMHAAFYSPTNCDAPPTDEEIRMITTWLSTL
jgi:cytochrome c553